MRYIYYEMMKNIPEFLRFSFGILFCLTIPLLTVPQARAQCDPVTAQIYSSGDDNTVFWVNGTPVPGEQTYCHVGSCVPTPIPVPLSDLDEGQSIVLSVATTNVNPSQVLSAWDLDITCQGGDHVEITSENPANYSLYYDPNGNCAGANPPPNDPSGNSWYSFIYNPTTNYFTETGIPVTAAISYTTLIYDPVNGDAITQVSFNSSAGPVGSCGILYWREVMAFPTPEPTLGPANVTVTNSLIAGSVTTNGNYLYASYAVTVCDSGMPIESVPVTVTDYFSSSMQGNSNTGYCPTPTSGGQGVEYQCNSPYLAIFPVGLPGDGACEAVTVNLINYYYPNDYCDPVTAIAVVDWQNASAPVSSNVVTFTIPCAPGSPTATPTSTFTFTPTPTFTPLFTPTPTYTPTITYTPTVTFTPTITFTPTPTIPNIDTFYVSKNVYNPTSDSPVSIFVQYTKFPGSYDLWIYNSAGEHIKTLESTYLSAPVSQAYTWDGKNKYGDACASGVYIFYLVEPFERQYKRILLIH